MPLTSLAIAQFEGQARNYCSWQEHSKIIDALQEADAEKAETLMNQHLAHLEQRLLGGL